MYCQLLVSENIFLKYVFEYLEIELEKIIKLVLTTQYIPATFFAIPAEAGIQRHCCLHENGNPESLKIDLDYR